MAAGFAPGTDVRDADARILPARVKNGDLEIESGVPSAPRCAAETAHWAMLRLVLRLAWSIQRALCGAVTTSPVSTR
jgi:hypothetical protein